MFLLELFEDWDHYTEIGHKKGALVYYMLPGGKIVTHEYHTKKDNHDMDEEDGYEAKAMAVGRIDLKQNKISVRTPMAPGNRWYMIPDAKLEYIRKRLERAYPGFEIWYFGNHARDIRRIDSAAPLLESAGLAGLNRDEIARFMAQSIVTGKNWDADSVARKPELATIWETAEGMLQEFEDELPDHVREIEDIYDQIDTPEFHALVLRWAYTRFDEVIRKLQAIPKDNGGYDVKRVMRIQPRRLASGGSLGVFWTYDYSSWSDARAIWAPEYAGREYLIHAVAPETSVNWRMTVLANMDWYSGDEEFEMRLIANSPITVRAIEDHESGKPLNLELYGDPSKVLFTA